MKRLGHESRSVKRLGHDSITTLMVRLSTVTPSLIQADDCVERTGKSE